MWTLQCLWPLILLTAIVGLAGSAQAVAAGEQEPLVLYAADDGEQAPTCVVEPLARDATAGHPFGLSAEE